MRHPSEYYIKYLLAMSWGADEEEQLDAALVSEALTDFDLPPVDGYTFDRIRGAFEPPEGFRFESRSHQPSIDFMKEEKIYSYWTSSEDMKRCMNVLLGDVNRLIQHKVRTLLMGRLPPEVISEKVSKMYHLKESITPGMVEHYRHYFWRVESLTEAEWHVFLADSQNYDPYMASLMCGDQQALFRAGMNPKYDYKLGLRDTHRQIVFRIQYLGFQPDNKRNIDLLVKLSREQRSLYDILYGEGGGLEEQLREIRHFMMEHKIPDVKTLESLITTGSYSNDGSEEDKKLPAAAAQKAIAQGKKKAKPRGPRVGSEEGED